MNINNLLPKDAHFQRRKEVQSLQRKWQRTGLLEGLNERDMGSVSQLLENQAKQLVTEANRTSTQSGAEEWAGVALPLVRRIFGEFTAKDFVSVQPLNLPSGLVFWLEYKYGTGQPGFTTGAGLSSQEDSVWGVTDARKGDEVATGGLYGAGRFGYTINDYSSSILYASASLTPTGISGSVTAANTTTDVNFNTEFAAKVNPAHLFKVTFPTSQFPNADLLGARAFTLSGTGVKEVFNEFTTISNDNSLITFLISGSAVVSNAKVFYHKQPTDITRGDFEENKTQDNPLDIPELNLEFHSETLTAKSRKLKAQWTPEFAQDINAYQNVDAEAELTGILGEYVAREIELEILDMLRVSAQSSDYWSARLGYEYSAASHSFNSINNVAAAYTQGTWFQTIGTKINKMSAKIDQLTMRGGVNFIVTNPTIGALLASIPGFASSGSPTDKKFSGGTRKVGDLKDQYQVYISSYMKENVMICGYRGGNYLETGAVYAPYIPLIMTPLVHDPDNFTPRKAVMTRYAKKMLRPEFYGKIFVEGLDSI